MRGFYTSVHLGFDFLVAEKLIELKNQVEYSDLKICTVISSLEYFEKMSSEQKIRYKKIVDNCDTAHILSVKEYERIHIEWLKFVTNITGFAIVIGNSTIPMDDGTCMILNYMDTNGVNIQLIDIDKTEKSILNIEVEWSNTQKALSKMRQWQKISSTTPL